MGKGGLNRVLLTADDATHTSDIYVLPRDDGRATHIRTFLYDASPTTLRVAVAQQFLHDAAIASVQDDQSVRIQVPVQERQPAPRPPPVALIVAMQRPKVIGRVLEAAAALGVAVICVVAADKVEKSYWDCKLFRPAPVHSPRPAARSSDPDDDDDDRNLISSNIPDQHVTPDGEPAVHLPMKRPKTGSALIISSSTTDSLPGADSLIVASELPGRPRGARNHPHLNAREQTGELTRRVDELAAVRRRLELAVQQANTDAHVPAVILERRGLSALLKADHQMWEYVGWTATRVVAHPYRHDGKPLLAISSVISGAIADAAVLAIGPEGGWTPAELTVLVDAGFVIAGLGTRVLRSETAVVVSLGLVHEGLRIRDARTQLEETEDHSVQERNAEGRE